MSKQVVVLVSQVTGLCRSLRYVYLKPDLCRDLGGIGQAHFSVLADGLHLA